MNQSSTSHLGLTDSRTASDRVGTAAQDVSRGPRTETVFVSSLLPGDTPRSGGQDQEHIARLAEIDEPLPPILVERRSMRVIDGIHRLLAMLLKGQETIEVEFFDGSAEDAFLRGVTANVTHGLPLSHADRKAAAARILTSHPHMSDRAIARASGLGAKTVAAIRRDSSDALACVKARVGSDGKVRPLNSAEGRLRAAEVLAERPEASLREVARIAGISPATVSDVRKRIAVGELPVNVRSDAADLQGDAATPARDLGARNNKGPKRPEQVDPAPVLKKLLRDPSLRHNQEGRNLLRVLQQNAIAMTSELTVAVPPHCRELVVKLARQYAETWFEFARELEVLTKVLDVSADDQDGGGAEECTSRLKFPLMAGHLKTGNMRLQRS